MESKCWRCNDEFSTLESRDLHTNGYTCYSKYRILQGIKDQEIADIEEGFERYKKEFCELYMKNDLERMKNWKISQKSKSDIVRMLKEYYEV